MGQRLVITAVKNHTPIFNIYYHWSAYTTSALAETNALLNWLLCPENCNDLVLSAIDYCERCGGGLITGDLSMAQSLYPSRTFKEDGISRNEGLIAISAEEMNDTLKWAEGSVQLDFDNDTVDFDVFFGYTSLNELNDELYDEENRIKPKEVYVPSKPITHFYFDQIDAVFDIVESHDVFEENGYILTKIE